jgi:threonine dehydrogenase-like Zn-dependent dehydrogenase
LLPIPDNLRDEQVLFLSDIACTAWHGLELGEVKEGDVIAIWGCGPVGLLAVMLAKVRGASRIIAIDNVANRLKLAAELGAETINYNDKKVIPTMLEVCPGGPDICLDATGFGYAKEYIHKVEKFVGMETDACSAITEMIYLVKKFGRISVIGDYFGTTNHFPIGMLFMKGITFRAGVVCVQKYWKMLLNLIIEGKIDLTRIITHTMPLSQAPEAYRMFDVEKNSTLKIILKPGITQNETLPAE